MSDDGRLLTDEELAEIEQQLGRYQYPEDLEEIGVETFQLIVRDLRRLRSDEWLKAAVGELLHGPGEVCDAHAWPHPCAGLRVLDLFRKHRDGKA